ncbi:hypothetical protein BGZ65_003942 [Modicella reniformis]|uniref:Uncharacterized protein n=1 Tax=Modicella reniformis TaxID=1440133 RepID=A0A9P6LZN1_9FUNG|nr:hypothetical protein BGZ65_003942 [Modicella reniformis]
MKAVHRFRFRRRIPVTGDGQGPTGENNTSHTGVHLDAKSRWKSEYLRVTSSSPSGSFISAISEIMPEILPRMILNEDKSDNDHHGSANKDEGSTTTSNSIPAEFITTVGTQLLPSLEVPETTFARTRRAAAFGEYIDSMATLAGDDDAAPETITKKAAEEEFDRVEQDLIAKIEELRKEKTRLFSLFKAPPKDSVQQSPVPQSTATMESTTEESEPDTTEVRQDHRSPLLVSNGTSTTPLEAQSRETSESASVVESKDEPKKQTSSRKSSDQEYDRKTEPLKSNGKRHVILIQILIYCGAKIILY